MLLSVEPEKWYSVGDVARCLGWSRDTVIRLIEQGYLQAFVKPNRVQKRCRENLCHMVQGCEIIRFVKDNLSIPKPRLMR